MKPLNFAFRLLKHGGIFVFRVTRILLPVIVGVWQFVGGAARSAERERSHPFGMPEIDEFDHPLWDEYWGTKSQR